MLFQEAVFRTHFLLCGYLVLCCSHGSFRCPALEELGKECTIIGNITEQNYNGIAWVRPKDGFPVVVCSAPPVCSGFAGYSASVNSASSTLTIRGLVLEDVGNWSIVGNNKTNLVTTICYLTAAKSPTTCSIQADMDTNNLDEGDNVTLDIEISQYYCTRNHSFSLTTGNVTDKLYEKDSESEIKDITTTACVNVTKNHFGSVRVIFQCEEREWELTCTGVNELKERTQTTTPTTTEALEIPITTLNPTTEPSGIPTTTLNPTTQTSGILTTLNPTTPPSGILTTTLNTTTQHSGCNCQEGIHGVSLFAGFAIGVTVMLLCGVLLYHFVFRRRIPPPLCIFGDKNSRPSEGSLEQRAAPSAVEAEPQQAAAEEGDYAMAGNFYERLQRENVDITAPYEELRI